MSALRFAAGVGAGVAFAALVAGAAGVGAPLASEPDAPPAQRHEAKPAGPAEAAARPGAAPKKGVSRGVLARAAASRRAASPGTAAAPAGAAKDARSDSKEAVIESVEVDWGAAPARP